MDENQSQLIDADAFRRYANALGLKMACPVCSKSDLTLSITQQGRSLCLVDWSMEAPSLADLRVMEVMSLGCDTCGHERLFKRDHVAAWLRAHP